MTRRRHRHIVLNSIILYIPFLQMTSAKKERFPFTKRERDPLDIKEH